MCELNPAKTLIPILQVAKEHQQANIEGIQFNENYPPYEILRALDLLDVDGFSRVDAFQALASALDWMSGAAETVSPKKAKRYRDACSQIKDRINYEFGRLRAEGAPVLLYDRLIVEFEHFAEELEDHLNFPHIDEATIQDWEDTLIALETQISGSRLDPGFKNTFVDVLLALRASVRDLRRFGTGACDARLKDALGRIVAAGVSAPKDEQSENLVKRAFDLFLKITSGVEAVDKLSKALPPLYHKILP